MRREGWAEVLYTPSELLKSRSFDTLRAGDPATRFLSRDECAALYTRIASWLSNGEIIVDLVSTWTGTTRFSSNTIRTSRDIQTNNVKLVRTIAGAAQKAEGDQISDRALRAMLRRLESEITYLPETSDDRLRDRTGKAAPTDSVLKILGLSHQQALRELGATNLLAHGPEPTTNPKLFFDSTYAMDPSKRAAAVHALVAPAAQAGLLAAGEIEVTAEGHGFNNTAGENIYYPVTTAAYSVTVRDPAGQASGWAGVNWNDWDRVDPQRLSAIALDKCVRSHNPIRVEPGRYTVILEPQAVWDLAYDLWSAPFDATLLGQPYIDKRLSVGQDPTDSDCSSAPFSFDWNALRLDVFHPARWIDHGVMTQLPYTREEAIRQRHQDTGLPASGVNRVTVHGLTMTIDEMVASSQRAILVTRFGDVGSSGGLRTGYTRDGTWLVEHGKITKPVKNLGFSVGVRTTLNSIEQIGVPQRVFTRHHGIAAAVIPALMVRDFQFTTLTDAV